MAIYEPKPSLTENDKRLLALMAKLLLERLAPQSQGSNLPEGMLVLSNQEAEELMDRLEQLVNTRKFLEASYFVESLTLPNDREKRNAKEIYLSARTRFGRTRVLASRQWAEFEVRLGINTSLGWYTQVRPMAFDHFLNMERKLFSAAGLHPRVGEILIRLINSEALTVEDLRRGRKSLEIGSIKRAVVTPFKRWWEQARTIGNSQISTARISAAMTVIADTSVLFSTRDWGIAGTLSTMAGAAAAMKAD